MNDYRQRMHAHNLNITELARRAGLDRATVSKIVNGYFDKKLSKALGNETTTI